MSEGNQGGNIDSPTRKDIKTMSSQELMNTFAHWYLITEMLSSAQNRAYMRGNIAFSERIEVLVDESFKSALDMRNEILRRLDGEMGQGDASA